MDIKGWFIEAGIPWNDTFMSVWLIGCAAAALGYCMFLIRVRHVQEVKALGLGILGFLALAVVAPITLAAGVSVVQ